MHSSSKNPIYPWHFEKSIAESYQEVPSSCFTHTDYTGKVNFRQVWLFQGTLRVRSWAAIPPWCRVSEVSHDERWHPQVRGGAGREGHASGYIFRGDRWSVRAVISPGLLDTSQELPAVCQSLTHFHGDPATWVKSSCLSLHPPAGEFIYWKPSVEFKSGSRSNTQTQQWCVLNKYQIL